MKHTEDFLNWFREQNGIKTMSYRGMMDGWHGDEYDCTGHCGLCEECNRQMDRYGDDEYEAWHEEQHKESNP